MRRTLTLAIALLLLHARTADAEPPRTEERSYAGTMLAVDGTLIALALPSVGATALVLPVSGPLLHVSKGRNLAALGSLGLRIGLPAAGYALATAQSCQTKESMEHGGDCVYERIYYTAGGLLVAIIVDAAVLARHEVVVEQAPRVVPTVQVDASAAVVGVAAAF